MGRSAPLSVVLVALFSWSVAACGDAPSPTPSAPPGGSVTDSASPAAVPVSGTVEVPAVAASCFPDEPCDPPVVAGQLVLSHDGDVVARVPLGARGAFTTRLPPGTYAVSVTPGGPGIRLRPGTLTVPPEGLTDVRLRLVRATS